MLVHTAYLEQACLGRGLCTGLGNVNKIILCYLKEPLEYLEGKTAPASDILSCSICTVSLLIKLVNYYDLHRIDIIAIVSNLSLSIT